ncbi:MAG: HD domain-containing protein [Firmicutes bacterium]|nr:HD domain-containing protein [Bacillota bacterium]
MGLLNRKPATVSPSGGVGAVLGALKPPYPLKDFLLTVLNQLSEWIPAEGYYAYVADPDDGQLSLRVTRAATGIATVGPNYAGLVLGSGIRTVPLNMAPLVDPAAFHMASDGMLEIGLGPNAVLRIAVEARFRLAETERNRIQQWIHQILPLFDLVSLADGRLDPPARRAPEVRRSRQDLLLQIPHLMGLLSELGTSVLKSTDGYLAVWDDALHTEFLWDLGLGLKIAERLRPTELYRGARPHRFAVWDPARLPESLKAMGFHSLVAIPLNADDGTAGVLCFATTEAVQAARSLADSLRYLAESLENSLKSRGSAHTMAQNYLDALLTSTTLLDDADPYNANHHRQVAQLAARLALKAGWSESRVHAMELAGRLHDVGMVTVALDLTTQRGNLAEQAREVIQQHPSVGSELLSGLPDSVLPGIVARAVREHHERWDGMGYPDGLKEGDLSEEGRLLACAEQFVARISNRSYRQGLSVERALYEVQQLAGRQLDPDVVKLLTAVYADAGVRPVAPQ